MTSARRRRLYHARAISYILPGHTFLIYDSWISPVAICFIAPSLLHRAFLPPSHLLFVQHFNCTCLISLIRLLLPDAPHNGRACSTSLSDRAFLMQRIPIAPTLAHQPISRLPRLSRPDRAYFLNKGASQLPDLLGFVVALA